MSKAITAAVGTALGAFAILATTFVTSPQAATRVETGLLTCTAAGSTGYIVSSTRHLRCRFRHRGHDEYYIGTIRKFGLDLGSTRSTRLAWAVLAPTRALPPRSLVGSFGGVSAEATVGVGVGANALVGGSSKSIVLQPVSVQAQRGLNIAAGIAALELRPVR
jgi:hypothetical protein